MQAQFFPIIPFVIQNLIRRLKQNFRNEVNHISRNKNLLQAENSHIIYKLPQHSFIHSLQWHWKFFLAVEALINWILISIQQNHA